MLSVFQNPTCTPVYATRIKHDNLPPSQNEEIHNKSMVIWRGKRAPSVRIHGETAKTQDLRNPKEEKKKRNRAHPPTHPHVPGGSTKKDKQSQPARLAASPPSVDGNFDGHGHAMPTFTYHSIRQKNKTKKTTQRRMAVSPIIYNPFPSRPVFIETLSNSLLRPI